MAADTHDISRDAFMLDHARFAHCGYDWWWHNFTGLSTRTKKERSFFVEFFCINPALGGPKPIFGQLPDNKKAGILPSYLMIKAGCWGDGARQLHRFFGWDAVEVGHGAPYFVVADDCLACETDLLGQVKVSRQEAQAHPERMSDAGFMAWNLHMDKQIAYNVGPGASSAVRNAEAFEMFWHAEGIKTAYQGWVILDGELFEVTPEESWGYADKNWGGDFTSPWLWLASSDLSSRLSGRRLMHSALEIGGGKPKVGRLALDHKLLGCLNYEGEVFEFNFSKPWTGSQTRFECYETTHDVVWHVEQETFKARLVTDVRCHKNEMVLSRYEAPNGTTRHTRLWNGGTGRGRIRLWRRQGYDFVLVDDLSAAHVGCEYGEYDAHGPY